MNAAHPRWKLRRLERQRRSEEDDVTKEDQWDQCDPPIAPEQNVWVAVILQAFMDASWHRARPDEMDGVLAQGELGRAYRDVMGKKGKMRRIYESQRIQKATERRAHAYDAIGWLLGKSRDFYDVCLLAGYEPGAVRDAARTAEAKGWPPIAEW